MPVIISSGFGGAPPAPVKQPDEIAGLLLWFDATDASTIVKDGSDKVSQWIDKTGSPSNDALQGTASEQPTWVSGGINGQDAIEFFNSEYLVATGGAWNQVTNLTFFVVHKPDLLSGVHFAAGTPYDGGAVWDAPFVAWQLGVGETNSDDARQWISIGGTNREWVVSSVLSGQGQIQTLLFDGTTRKSYLDGVENFSNADHSGNITYGSPNPNFCIGVRSDASLGEYYDGMIGEIIAYDNALSEADIEQIHTYLKNKWSI